MKNNYVGAPIQLLFPTRQIRWAIARRLVLQQMLLQQEAAGVKIVKEAQPPCSDDMYCPLCWQYLSAGGKRHLKFSYVILECRPQEYDLKWLLCNGRGQLRTACRKFQQKKKNISSVAGRTSTSNMAAYTALELLAEEEIICLWLLKRHMQRKRRRLARRLPAKRRPGGEFNRVVAPLLAPDEEMHFS